MSSQPRRGEQDYYALLGVPPTATDEQIRRAHRQLALLSHPDRLVGQPPEVARLLQDRFMLVEAAYECLSDPDRRAAYDALGRSGAGTGKQSMLELVVPPAERGKYDPATLRRLLTLAGEEASLIKTAQRLGATSSIEMNLNAIHLIETTIAAQKHFVEVVGTWLRDDAESWNIPSHNIMTAQEVALRKEMLLDKKRRQESGEAETAAPPAAAAAATEAAQAPSKESAAAPEQQQEQPVAVSAPAPPPAKPDPPPASAYVVTDPAVLEAEVNGARKVILIPRDEEQAAVKAATAAAAQRLAAYTQQLQEWAKANPEEAKKLVAAAATPGAQPNPQQQQQQGNDGSKAEEAEAAEVHYGRPPFHALILYWTAAWAPSFQKAARNSFMPYSASGRYAWQCPIADHTVSLLSVSGSRSGGGKQSEMKVEIDAETRLHDLIGTTAGGSSNTVLLWSAGLGTAGTKLTLGVKRVLSKLYTIKAKLMCWKETGEGCFPQLLLTLERKLSAVWGMTATVRLPGPWEPANSASMNIAVENKERGVGLRCSHGSVVGTFVTTAPFVFFPVVSRSNHSNNGASGDATAVADAADSSTPAVSVFKALRQFETTVERVFEVHLNLTDPIFRAESTYFFTRSFDTDEWESELRKQRSRKQKQNQQRQQADADAQNKERDAGNDLFESSDDDEDDDDQGSANVNDGSENKDEGASAADGAGGAQFKDHFERKHADQRAKDEARTLASPMLRHSFGVAVSVAIPLKSLLLSLLGHAPPQNRAVNTTLSLSYKRGEHRLALPMRVSFSQSPLAGLLLYFAPQISNYAASGWVSDAVLAKQQARTVERRLRADPRVRQHARRAELERQGMDVAARKSVAAETAKNGLVIVSAQYGVLRPVLRYPAEIAGALVVDVTVAVQHIVAQQLSQTLPPSSVVHIAGGSSKALLPGFYDPHPGASGGSRTAERKQLKIAYRWQGKMHTVVVGDREPLTLPKVEHLDKQ